jgi:hypothetical protein
VEGALYDDGRIACDDLAVTIRWYYPWGPKKIPYGKIRSVERRPLTKVRGKWRIWGSGDFVHWYNLDPTRPNKETAFEIDTGGRFRPTITPDDPDAVERILADHVAGTGTSERG